MKKLLEKLIERLLKKADNLSDSIDTSEDDSLMQKKINVLQEKVDFFKAITTASSEKNTATTGPVGGKMKFTKVVNESAKSKNAGQKKTGKQSRKGKRNR